MKNIMISLLVCIVISILVSGCYNSLSNAIQPTMFYDTPLAPTQQPTLPTRTAVFTLTTYPTIQLTETSTAIPTEYVNARLTTDCLDVAPTITKNTRLNGVIVMEKKETREFHTHSDFFLLNLETGHSIQLNHSGESQESHTVSPNRKQIAFMNFVEDTQGNLIRKEVIIADSSGQRLIVLPWQVNWAGFVGWADDLHLIFSLKARDIEEGSMRKPGLFTVLDFSSGRQQILNPAFPHFVFDPSVVLPVWDGWIGVMYDPSLSLAIYPSFLSNDQERFTYTLWDVEKQLPIKSFEDIFTAFTVSGVFPPPRWTPDGAQFIFLGRVEKENQVEFELYRISRDGKTEQLTSLAPITSIWDQDYSWSPNGQLISLIIGPPAPEKAHLAVLNVNTLAITDYCFPISYMGNGYGTLPPANAIWSPDGMQLVVQDWYEKEHRNIIVVDIIKKVAVKVFEDMEPIGWMVGMN